MISQSKEEAIVEIVMNARLWQRCFVKEPETLEEGFGAIANACSHIGNNCSAGDLIKSCRLVIGILVACEQFMYTLPNADQLDEVLIDVMKNGWQIGNQTS